MKWLLALLTAAIFVCGCNRTNEGTGHEGSLADTNNVGVREQDANDESEPKRMPGGVGLSGGQSGTGTTSGASTGY